MRQAGPYRVLTTGQLCEAGLSEEAIRYRVQEGRLQHPWRGVYIVGPPPPSPLCLSRAAIAITDDRGFLAHRWGIFGWGIGPRPEFPIDVTVTRGSRRGRAGKVKVHLSSTLEPRDTTTRHGIPILSPACCFLDVAPYTSAYELERLVADGQVAGVVTEAAIRELLGRAGRHRGAAKLAAIITEAPGVTRAESERILRRLLREADLPQPESDAPVLYPYRADFLYREQRVVLEVDGFGTHGHRQAFEHDRERTAKLVAAGFVVVPITLRQMQDKPIAVVTRIAQALARRAPAH